MQVVNPRNTWLFCLQTRLNKHTAIPKHSIHKEGREKISVEEERATKIKLLRIEMEKFKAGGERSNEKDRKRKGMALERGGR